MKIFKFLVVTLTMTLTSFSGLGAEPSKPDFAFPKTVSKDAEADLKVALRAKNGPDILSALIRYSLAQTAINPEKSEAVCKRLEKVESEVDSPVSRAMIKLLRAEVCGNDSLALDVWKSSADALKVVPVTDWKKVIDAQPQFFPSLYDFAAAKAPFDSVAPSMREFYSARPLPRLYWLIGGYQDYKALLAGYDEIKSYPESAYLLTSLTRQAHSLEMCKEVYVLTREWMAVHASSPYRQDVERLERQLCAPSLTIYADNVVGRNKPIKVSVNARCLNSGSVRVEQIKGAGGSSFSRELKFEGSGVFEADTTIELTFANYGVYRLTPVFNGQTDVRRRDYIEISVTDILLWRENYSSKAETYALDVINGAPQTDVVFRQERNQIYASRGKDMFTPGIYSGYHQTLDKQVRYRANVLTDRGLYHPGETMKFVGVIMSVSPDGSHPASGRSATVYLINANYQRVDTLNLVSDNFGRVTGEFKLPSDGLTGNYRAELEGMGTAFFTVTDYKAPTFEVKTECDRMSDTSARVSGSAVGYNGFPIADADVKIFVRTLPRWVWWRDFRNNGGATVAETTVRTDADGKFEADVEFAETDLSLSVTAEVASPTGETHEDSAFVPAMPYYISAEIPEYFVPGKAPKIQVLNSRGEEEKIPLIIELTSKADSAVVHPDETWSNVPSGEYSIKIRPEEPAFATPFEHRGFYVYRPSDKMPPAEMALFVPQHKVAPGEKLLLGTSYGDSHILMTVWNGKQIISQKWLTPACGNFFEPVNLPDSVESATVSLVTLRNYLTEVVNVSVVRPNIRRNLTLKFSSFRDRMVPGERERWSISVADNLGKGVESAVILDVYSKALDAISPFGWNFHVSRPEGYFWNLNFSRPYSPSARAYKSVDNRNPLTISVPAFDLYGRAFPGRFEIMNCVYTTTAAPLMMSRKMMALDVDVAEMESDEAVAYGAVDFDDAVLCENACESADSGAGAVATESGEVTETAPLDEFRVPEVAVALWAPVLTTAADGSLQVEFEAPNANTTWKLMCQAYDMDLLNGYHQAEIVAAKPVMVQPQVPRFLRVGDRTELRAMIMNASDSAASVESFIEIFDPVTDEIFVRKDFTNEIDAGASETVSLPLQAPDRSMLGIRVKASSGNFSDGEQNVIAILPAVITARSATPLFFGADSTAVEFDVPRGSVVTLTTNAAWECVTALPGLASSESKSAFASTSALFSAAVGRGLVRTYPQIASALSRWHDTDSVLISKLSKNEDLKIALLSATPWPAAAQTDTERMARLLLLLDRREADRVIDSAVDNLAKLVRKGGLAWTPDSEEPSLWVTEEFLSVMARLRRLGYMPSSNKLQRIISGAVKYLDNEIARDYAKYKGEYPDYAEIRPNFSEIPQSAPAKRAQNATVQYLVSHWRDLGFTSQAQAALILRSSGYQSTARTIIESLRQYEAWRQTGLNAELLDAFAAVEPQCAEVDEIRQFFIERKQAMDWGDGLPTSHLIASILSSGSDWLVPAENEMLLRIDGVETKPEGAEAVMGSFRLELPSGGKVELDKGKFPAWGGVFTSLTDTISSVPAVESEKLQIARRIEGDFNVGSRVKVIIEINATQPLDYVVVKSPRPAGFSVVDQMPGRMWLPGSYAYREPCATETNWFFSRLVRGKTVLTEEFFVTSEGTFLMAPAEVQSQYAPEFHSHSAGSPLTTE